MKGKQIIDKILEQYKHEDINFDMYIVADAQTKPCVKVTPAFPMLMKASFSPVWNLLRLRPHYLMYLDLPGCFTVRYLLLNMSSIIKYSRRIASFIIFRVTE